jgi:hypothetical protein
MREALVAHQITTDLGRVEDLAAAALAAGRRAAAGLRALHVGPSARGTQAAHYSRLLTTERLFDDVALATLDEVERELERLVHAESYLCSAYLWAEPECDPEPVRRLTELGYQLETVRSRLAEALRLAHEVTDLLAAEAMVGRLRGFGT